MSKGCKIDVYITMELRDSVKLLASIKICLNYTYFLFHYVALVSYYFFSRLSWQLYGQSTKQTLVFINTYSRWIMSVPFFGASLPRSYTGFFVGISGMNDGISGSGDETWCVTSVEKKLKSQTQKNAMNAKRRHVG